MTEDLALRFPLSGATRVIAIFGDPIVQVKSPAGVTRALQARGRNAVVVPIHVAAEDVPDFVRGATVVKNFDGLIATIPHKFAAYRLCASASPRAHFLQAVNTLRRDPAGGWHGDMFDGIGFVKSAIAHGARPAGAAALLAGAGGAGSAIAHALIESGVARLAVHDTDPVRRDALVARLNERYPERARAGDGDPTGCTVIVNASPAGMAAGDPLPIDAARIGREMFVGEVITAPVVTPLLAAARRAGCATSTGVDMFSAVAELMVEFFLG